MAAEPFHLKTIHDFSTNLHGEGSGVVTTSQIRYPKALQALRRYPLPLRTSHEVTHLEGMGKAGISSDEIPRMNWKFHQLHVFFCKTIYLGWLESQDETNRGWLFFSPFFLVVFHDVPPYKDFREEG